MNGSTHANPAESRRAAADSRPAMSPELGLSQAHAREEEPALPSPPLVSTASPGTAQAMAADHAASITGGSQSAPAAASSATAPADGTTGSAGTGQTASIYLQPVLIHDIPPIYPVAARLRGWEGRVVLELLITAEGLVGEIKVVESSGHQLLDQAAIKAARQWRYLPAQRDGEAIEARLLQAVRFQLT